MVSEKQSRCLCGVVLHFHFIQFMICSERLQIQWFENLFFFWKTQNFVGEFQPDKWIVRNLKIVSPKISEYFLFSNLFWVFDVKWLVIEGLDYITVFWCSNLTFLFQSESPSRKRRRLSHHLVESPPPPPPRWEARRSQRQPMSHHHNHRRKYVLEFAAVTHDLYYIAYIFILCSFFASVVAKYVTTDTTVTCGSDQNRILSALRLMGPHFTRCIHHNRCHLYSLL